MREDPAATKAIHALDQEFAKLYNAGKFDRLASTFYAEDARVFAPNQPEVRGRRAIERFFRESSDRFANVQPEPGPVVASGDLAVVTGTYRMDVTMPDGSTMEDRGKYIEAFLRQPDGSYRCFLDNFTSDMEQAEGARPEGGPAPEGPPEPESEP